jgi:hypothetical protein
MSNDPTSRAELRRRLAASIGDEAADTLMEALPPHSWDELATKHDVFALKTDLEAVKADVAEVKADVAEVKADVAGLRREFEHHRELIDARFEANEHKLMSAFRGELARTVVISQFASVLATAGVVIAAAKLL